MDVSCVVEVDVNGEEIFIVDKEIISSYSGKISNLLGKSTTGTKILRVIFHNFPGGAEGFEIMTRFCYNNGKIEINPLNFSLLCCISRYMEMNKSIGKTRNLHEQTEKCLEEIKYWAWSELLVALKQCQDLLPFGISSNILRKFVDSLVSRIALPSELSPCSSVLSSDSPSIRLSCDTRSTESLKSRSSRGPWWFEDLVALNPSLIEMVIKSMIFQNFDHAIISRFLIYYQKSRLTLAKSDGNRKILESVIDMLYLLDKNSIACKSLFRILRVALGLKISKCSMNKLETMIGLQMDQATLDDLLFPSPIGTNNLYDVNLVLRFLKSFWDKGTCRVPLVRLKKTGSLMDLYLAEVAPDPSLKSSKFLALVQSLPDSARDSYDGIYRAMDIYLQVHTGLSEEEKTEVCCELNYEKLSSEACNHLGNNKKFPSRSGVGALISQQCKLKTLLQETSKTKAFSELPTKREKKKKSDDGEGCDDQIVVYAGKLNVSAENAKLRAHIQGMQWRVNELEKVCRKMQSQMANIMKSSQSQSQSQSSYRSSLPKLCS